MYKESNDDYLESLNCSGIIDAYQFGMHVNLGKGFLLMIRFHLSAANRIVPLNFAQAQAEIGCGGFRIQRQWFVGVHGLPLYQAKQVRNVIHGITSVSVLAMARTLPCT